MFIFSLFWIWFKTLCNLSGTFPKSLDALLFSCIYTLDGYKAFTALEILIFLAGLPSSVVQVPTLDINGLVITLRLLDLFETKVSIKNEFGVPKVGLFWVLFEYTEPTYPSTKL